MTALGAAINRAKTQTEERLLTALRTADAAPPLAEAAAHALIGGKALRAFLVMESARICGASAAAALEAAAAIECIHAYSLVHDDLPAMDDDDVRRGKPTVHIAWNEATAILVGDGLQSLAYGLLAGIDDAPPERVVRLVASLAQAAGMAGMVGGQMRDIQAETRVAPASGDALADIRAIQVAKTGALFSWSAQVGPILAGTNPAPFARYADALGQAFQVQDDLLDATGDATIVGKAVGKDGHAGKATYVSLLGVEGAQKMACQLRDAAIATLDPFGPDGQTLADLARFVVDRNR